MFQFCNGINKTCYSMCSASVNITQRQQAQFVSPLSKIIYTFHFKLQGIAIKQLRKMTYASLKQLSIHRIIRVIKCMQETHAALTQHSFKHVDICKKLKADISINNLKLPTMYWIPKLHKNPYKARFIAASSSCTTKHISVLLTSCLSKIKEHVKFYCETTYNNSGINLFWSIKNSNEVLTKIKMKDSQISYKYLCFFYIIYFSSTRSY